MKTTQLANTCAAISTFNLCFLNITVASGLLIGWMAGADREKKKVQLYLLQAILQRADSAVEQIIEEKVSERREDARSS